MTTGVPPLEAWKEALAEWAIPDEILAAAPESPWVLPAQLFGRRADSQSASQAAREIARQQSISLTRAAEALRPEGTVLDVGAGAGAASLPLVEWTTELVAVDHEPAMLEQLRSRAVALGVPVTTIEGSWPLVAERTPTCDVVVCSHVLYNVPELAPFTDALARHARRRVVLELTGMHPASALNPLWLRFHGLRRPSRPTWQDAVHALSATGVTPVVERELNPPARPQAASFAELVAWTRRRLCLSPERDAEVAAALTDLGAQPERPESWSLRPQGLVVIWWDRG